MMPSMPANQYAGEGRRATSMVARPMQRAFSLVELSVVIVILGLLVGGIVGGKTLLNAGRAHSVVGQATGYAAAAELFYDQYGELPGDITRATQLWSGVANGNGNGVWEGNSSTENFQVWLHLARAGFITGSYTGAAGSGGSLHAAPGNSPAGALAGTLFWPYSWGEQVASSSFFVGNYDNLFVYGGVTAASWPTAAALTSADAYWIDNKADDGLPGRGNIRTFAGSWMQTNTGACITAPTGGDDPLQAAYLRSANKTCLLLFMQNYGKKKRI